MALVTKRSKDGKREYLYEQTSQRVGGKVKTTSRYVGPKKPRLRISLADFFMGGVAFAAEAATGGLKTKHYGERASYVGRKEPISRDEWAARMSQMSPQEWESYVCAVKGAMKAGRDPDDVREQFRAEPTEPAPPSEPPTDDPSSPASDAEPSQP